VSEEPNQITVIGDGGFYRNPQNLALECYVMEQQFITATNPVDALRIDDI
jgi:hypothetical protein